MKIKNKLLKAILLTTILTMSIVFVGCGKKEQNTSETATGAEPTTGIEPTVTQPAVTAPAVVEPTKPANNAEVTEAAPDATATDNAASDVIVYENTQYGFTFSLPNTWEGYTIITEEWTGNPLVDTLTKNVVGPTLLIRHPKWTSADPRQDIPIMIFTLAQWESMQNEDYHIGAAPFGPSELGRNSQYVFALPARYNFAFITGYEEIETLIEDNSLQATEDIKN